MTLKSVLRTLTHPSIPFISWNLKYQWVAYIVGQGRAASKPDHITAVICTQDFSLTIECHQSVKILH